MFLNYAEEIKELFEYYFNLAVHGSRLVGTE